MKKAGLLFDWNKGQKFTPGFKKLVTFSCFTLLHNQMQKKAALSLLEHICRTQVHGVGCAVSKEMFTWFLGTKGVLSLN